MAATDTFPSFSEICRTARDTEKRLLAATPSQISGVLHPGEATAIFPKEFDEYTYPLLLSEAHKVERKLFAASYAGTLTGQGAGAAAPPQIDERKMEIEAREVSDYELSQKPGEKKEGASRFGIPNFGGLRNPFGKKEGAKPLPEAAPVPSEEEIPAEVLMARRERMMRTETEAPSPEAPPAPTDEEKIAERRRGLVPEEAEEEELEKEAPVPMMDEEEQFEKPQEEQKTALEEEEAFEKPQETVAAPSAGPSSKLGASSKISPRLREIIEEKLRREEEKEHAELKATARAAPQEQEEEKEEPQEPEEKAASPVEEGEEEKIYMSARERLLAKLQKQKGKMAPASEEEEEEKRPARLRREARGEQEELEEKPAPPPLRAASPFAQKGGIQIKPIFAEEVGSQKEEEPKVDQEKYGEEKEGEETGQKSEDEESDERMVRIQRIIDELSPDKLKSKLEEKEEPEMGEEPVEKKRIKAKVSAEPEEEEVPEEGPGEKEKIPARIPVSKKQLQQKKVQAAAKGAKGKVLPKEAVKKPASRIQKAPPSVSSTAPQLRTLPQKKAAKALQKEEAQEEETPPQKTPVRVLPTKPVKPSVQPVSPKTQQQAEAKPRVLPGLGKSSGVRPLPLSQSVRPPAPKTYVPPVRLRAAQPEEEEKESKEPGEEQEKAEELQQVPPKKPAEQAPFQKPKPSIALPKQQLTSAERMLQARPKKQVLDEPFEEPPSPEMVEEDKRVKQRAEKLTQFARIQQTASAVSSAKLKKPHDIAGEAALPAEEEELSVPKPPTAEEEIPKPQDYAQAKEKLKYREQQEEITQNARKENEEMLESYAKENLTWLYEIYKMGGIAREAFLQKVQEKIDEEKGVGGPGAAEQEPENPALSNLEKQVEKKKKGWPF